MPKSNGRFKAGMVASNKLPVGTVTIREHRFDGKRAWVKVADPNKWMQRSVWNWMQHAGPIPKGFVVHHINENKLDDEITNLALTIRAGHIAFHRKQYREAMALKELPLKDIQCSKCPTIFKGKKQHEDSQCPDCKRQSVRGSKNRYKMKIREIKIANKTQYAEA